MEHVDQKYINALLNNEEDLLREIYKRFSGKLREMVLQHGGNETDAADVFQDTLLSIYNRAKKGDFNLTCPFEGFLYLIAKRKWIKELKKRDNLTKTILTKEASTIDTTSSTLAEECMMHEARRMLIAENIMKLGEKCKQLFHLSWEGNTMEEVAVLLNVSYGYARKKKSECMAKLIKLIHQSSEYSSLK